MTHLRIGYQPSTHQIAEMIAMEKGWWKEDLAGFGITEVTDHQFSSGPPEMTAMMGDHLDIAYVGAAPPITAIAQGLDAKIVAAVQTQGSNLVLRPDLQLYLTIRSSRAYNSNVSRGVDSGHCSQKIPDG